MYIHDLDPFALQIYGDFGVRWYGLSYMVAFILGYFLIGWLSQRQKAGLSTAMIGDLVTYIALGTLIGGRLGYCVFYSPDLFLKFKSSFPFWGVLAVNEGGMASHGGMIGIVIACLLFAKKYSVNSLYLFDLVTVTGPLGVFFGRIANFINGELVGRPAPESFAWSVKFPQDILSWPQQDFERLPSLADAVSKIGVGREQWLQWLSQYRVDPVSRNHIYETLSKIIQSIQDGNTDLKLSVGEQLVARYPSQLFGAAGEGLFVFIVLFLLWRTPKKPGIIGASFLVIYGFVRIWDEQYRMPDAQIGLQWLDLTRGQWLSIVMVITGFVLLFIWNRTGAIPIQGWRAGPSVKLGRN
ncbi:MAG: prolipoprotein diacylglyceryl transferase [Pseudobdellovibrionaceae bacterium]